MGLLSVILMLADHLTDWTEAPRFGINLITNPIVTISNIPEQSFFGLTGAFRSRLDLHGRIDELETELTLQRVKTEKMAALAAENDRLRRLLGSSEALRDTVLIAQIIGTSPDPARQEIIIDKGASHGATKGQPVINEEGLMGQVVRTSLWQSRVLLITDTSHSVPVQVMGSELRLIARGTGLNQQLEIRHVGATTDIHVGDELVSSGLGARFPAGYPVGMVERVDYVQGEPFATVTAKTSARLDQGRHVLLVFSDESRERRQGRAQARVQE